MNRDIILRTTSVMDECMTLLLVLLLEVKGCPWSISQEHVVSANEDMERSMIVDRRYDGIMLMHNINSINTLFLDL